MKTFLLSGGAAMLIPIAGLVYALISWGCSNDKYREAFRVTPPIFGKAVVVCANLGGLRHFSAVSDGDIALVRAVCNTGVEARFQIRYDGKPEGEAK